MVRNKKPQPEVKLLPAELEIQVMPCDHTRTVLSLEDNPIVWALRRLGFNALTASANLVYVTNGPITKCYLTDWPTCLRSLAVPTDLNPPFPVSLTELESEDELVARWEKINECIENSPATIRLI